MPEFEYKCVAGPTVISVKSEKECLKAVSAYEQIMNREAVGGWEYVGIDEFSTSEAQGCFGGDDKITTFKMLVFKRQKS